MGYCALGLLFGLISGIVLRILAVRGVRLRLVATLAWVERRKCAISETKAPRFGRRELRQALARRAGVATGALMEQHALTVIGGVRVAPRTRDPHRVLRDVCERYDGHIPLDHTVYPVRTDDVLAKETARRVRQSGSKDEASVASSVRKDARRAGRDAFKRLGLAVGGERLVALVGALRYRTSYAQNQYDHAIEVAELAGLLAVELGDDGVAARRSGLLHDMAKAEIHDRDGSHAIVGARLAAESGEAPEVVNAIAAHHGETPGESTTAALLIAADTLSGARPGARRQSTTNAQEMVRDIMSRVQNRAGVLTVDVMQGGREVRVMVDTSVADSMMESFAQSIAGDLENTRGLTGHVRVTVIRETRVSAIAR